MLLAEAPNRWQFVRDNLERHEQCVVATVGPDGQPWAVCVNMALDADANIVWQSRNDTVHSKNITHDTRVSLCVYSQSATAGDFGFYALAEAQEITDETELQAAITVRFGDKGLAAPSLDDLQGNAALRLYKAVLKQVWVNDASHKKQAVTIGEQ